MEFGDENAVIINKDGDATLANRHVVPELQRSCGTARLRWRVWQLFNVNYFTGHHAATYL